jgi:hypothetical protein
MPGGAAGEFQEDRVAAGRNLQSRWRVAVEFIVNQNLGESQFISVASLDGRSL